MDVKDLLTTDPSSLTPQQAQFVVNGATAALLAGVSHDEQAQLKDLLLEAQQIAQGRKIGQGSDIEIHERVAGMISEAEKRGDKRTAQALRDGMIAQDVQASRYNVDEVIENAARIREQQNAEAEKERKADLESLINIRTQELLYAKGWEINEDQARAEARRELTARS